MLDELHKELRGAGVQLVLSNPAPHVVHMLERTGLPDKLGREFIFVRVHDAVRFCRTQDAAMEAGGDNGEPGPTVAISGN
jgi:MFS superfamily sulfate permease-like transporter